MKLCTTIAYGTRSSFRLIISARSWPRPSILESSLLNLHCRSFHIALYSCFNPLCTVFVASRLCSTTDHLKHHGHIQVLRSGCRSGSYFASRGLRTVCYPRHSGESTTEPTARGRTSRGYTARWQTTTRTCL